MKGMLISRHPMATKAFFALCCVAAACLIYAALAAYLLRFSLERIVFLHTKQERTTETGRYTVVDSRGNEAVIRSYGTMRNGCVIFFPGRHGEIARYEKTLFASLNARGITVFTISCPGQNGAKGDGNFENVRELVEKALTRIDQDHPVRDMAFIGRSLGSMTALMAAERWHPRGLILEGAAPSLAEGVRSYASEKWYLRPVSFLPVRRIIKNDYSLTEAIKKLPDTNIAVFQGTDDSVTPLDKLERTFPVRSNARLIAVNGAGHSNAYVKALPLYVDTILSAVR